MSYIGINTLFASSETSNERFFQKYHFIYEDPMAYLQQKGIHVEDDVIQLSDLQFSTPKATGASAGGIYIGNGNTYFVKQCNSFHELVGSKFINFIVGTKCSPIVKAVKDQPRTVASLALPGFKMYQKTDKSKYKKILGEAELAIALDYVGIVDRHSRNMGYVRKNSKTLRAARVDFDATFDFESNATGSNGYSARTNHLDLKHLYISMQCYPKGQVKRAIKKIVNISDEQIITIVLQSWAALSQTPNPRSLDAIITLTQQLIERKNAFRQTLKKKHSKTDFEQFADLFN